VRRFDSTECEAYLSISRKNIYLISHRAMIIFQISILYIVYRMNFYRGRGMCWRMGNIIMFLCAEHELCAGEKLRKHVEI